MSDRRCRHTGEACEAADLQVKSSPDGTIQPMKVINLIHVMVAQAFYSWAMREINPLHPDLPRIMLRQRELSDKAHQILAA